MEKVGDTMYDLLIVDDEKIIREGIYELLSMEESLELNLSVASSGIEAKDILESRKIDIVLTDIQMPQLNGLELLEIIRERWPQCKVIFLTGYSEFDYVYKVHQHARYVLKAEEDSKIIEAVQQAIEEIENDFYLESMVIDTDILRQQQKVYERDLLLRDLIEGYAPPEVLDQAMAEEHDIQLKVDREVYFVVIKRDTDRKETYQEHLIENENIRILLNKYFLQEMSGCYVEYGRNFILVLLQPKKLIHVSSNIKMIQAMSEFFQKACIKNIGITMSVIIGSEPVKINQVIERFYSLKAKLLMVSEANIIRSENSGSDATSTSDENQIRSKAQRFDYYFESSNKEMVIAILQDISDLVSGIPSMHNLIVVETYTSIAGKLLAYINQFELTTEMCFRINVINLYNVTLHSNWKDAFHYLMQISEFIFELNQANLERQNMNVVAKVKKYITEHINEDLSLYILAEYVKLSPEYLLRLFKKSENTTILQYTNDLRLAKSKKLLLDIEKPIKEIAEEMGFSSSGYFARFFKSKMNMTPQNYREKVVEGKLDDTTDY